MDTYGPDFCPPSVALDELPDERLESASDGKLLDWLDAAVRRNAWDDEQAIRYELLNRWYYDGTLTPDRVRMLHLSREEEVQILADL